MPYSSGNKKIVFGILLFILVVFISILSAEILLRIIGYNYVPLEIIVQTEGNKLLGKRTDWRLFHEKEDQLCVYDSDLIWRPKKNYKILNAQGFRGPEIDFVKKTNEYRIFAIGDSNTAGPTGGSSWVEYLRDMLKNKYPHVTVVNAGVWGYTSWQGLKRFEKILKYKPDMVLISFGSNEAHRVSIPDKEYIASKRFFNKLIVPLRLCQLFIEINDILMMKNREESALIPRVSLEEYNSNLKEMIALADKNNVKVILLTRPFTGTSPQRLWWKDFAPQYNRSIIKAAEDSGVLAIDVYSYFEGKTGLFEDEAHFNDKGHKIAAKFIYDYLKTILNK